MYYTADRQSFFAADPVKVTQAMAEGISNISAIQNQVFTTEATARLRPINHRGIVTAAMVYDQLPIIDYFRQIARDTLLGVMDRRHDAGSYFFVLCRYGTGSSVTNLHC